MELTIMQSDKSVETVPVKRVFTIGTASCPQFLYYEQHADVKGHGKRIPMADIKCWEVNAIIVGGSSNLTL